MYFSRFGGDEFSFSRMSWIKTNFLWMMYRCGWASKKDQERVLAVTVSRAGFDEILANAYTAAVWLRNMSCVTRKPTMWFPNMSGTDRAVQSQKMARDWKFWI